MADNGPKSGSADSRRRGEYNPLMVEGRSASAIASQRRKEWCSSGRSSSMDSGISELPSSPHGTPSPLMPHSPTGPRPHSADRFHPRPASKRSYRQVTHRHSDTGSSSSSRPGSAFSNFLPLPHIGKQETDSESEDLPHQAENRTSPSRTQVEVDSNEVPSSPSNVTQSSPKPPTAKKVSMRELRRQQFVRRKNSQIDASSVLLTEPTENEPRILLAVKIPSGQRLQRYFRPSDNFSNVCAFAEGETKQSFSNCNMFINQVPKRLITNWKETFLEAGLTDRTLLCLEEKDE